MTTSQSPETDILERLAAMPYISVCRKRITKKGMPPLFFWAIWQPGTAAAPAEPDFEGEAATEHEATAEAQASLPGPHWHGSASRAKKLLLRRERQRKERQAATPEPSPVPVQPAGLAGWMPMLRSVMRRDLLALAELEAVYELVQEATEKG